MHHAKHMTLKDQLELSVIEHDLADARTRRRRLMNRLKQRAWREREKAK